MEQVELLISSCNISLTLLIEQYKKGVISLETFESNAKLKVVFLREHLDSLQSIKEKALAKQLLIEYEQITGSRSAPQSHMKTKASDK